MVSVMSLWLPIVLSAVLVFVVSSIIHTVLRYHRGDWRALLSRAGPAGGVGVAEVRARAALRRICGIRKGVTARGRSLLWGTVKVPSRLS